MTAIKKWFIMTFSLVLLISITSCTAGETEEPAEEINEISELTITSDGASDFYVIRSDMEKQDIVNCAVKLRRALSEKSGANIGISTDWEKNPTYEHEIIIGKTLRETDGQFDRISLGRTGYIIKEENGKIFILGGTDEGTALAVDYFLSNFVSKSDGNVSIPVGYEHIVYHQYDVPGFYIDMKKLDATNVILISDGADKKLTEAAETLRQAIYEKTGLMLSVKNGKSDSKAAFVVSNEKASENGAHEINVTNGALLFRSSAKSGVASCVNVFINEYINGRKGSVNFPADFRYLELGDYLVVSYPKSK